MGSGSYSDPIFLSYPNPDKASEAQGTSEYSSTIAYVAMYSARSQRSSGRHVTSARTITSHRRERVGRQAEEQDHTVPSHEQPARRRRQPEPGGQGLHREGSPRGHDDEQTEPRWRVQYARHE